MPPFIFAGRLETKKRTNNVICRFLKSFIKISLFPEPIQVLYAPSAIQQILTLYRILGNLSIGGNDHDISDSNTIRYLLSLVVFDKECLSIGIY